MFLVSGFAGKTGAVYDRVAMLPFKPGVQEDLEGASHHLSKPFFWPTFVRKEILQIVWLQVPRWKVELESPSIGRTIMAKVYHHDPASLPILLSIYASLFITL